ncbi:MAG: SPFH domain-containing protein, partial [Candidatus Cybelea sp.]
MHGFGSRSRVRVNPISLVLGMIALLVGIEAGQRMNSPIPIAAGTIALVLVILGLQMAYAWEAAVVLRAGRFRRLAGPGLFVMVPVVDNVAMWIDQRVHTSTFTAEQTLTEDTVPVDVDAVLFWVVWDAKKAALEVTSYE